MRRSHRRLIAAVVTALVATAAVASADPAPPARAATIYRLGLATKDDVWNAAKTAATLCPGVANAGNIAATMLAPVWGESGAGATGVPAPMAHSRWDTQASLSSGAEFWYPGIGIWQMDSAGLGRPWTAWQRVSTAVMAPVVAEFVAGKFCAATGDDLARARAAWGWSESLGAFTTWHACNAAERTACDTIFTDLYDGNGGLRMNNLDLDASVGSRGGMKRFTCDMGATTVPCYWMDFANTQGSTAFLRDGFGPTPAPKPYYSYSVDGSGERRQFTTADGWSRNTFAERPFTLNARGGLTWWTGTQVRLSRPAVNPWGFDGKSGGLQRIYSGRKLIEERTIRKGWTSIAIGNHSTTHPGHEIAYYNATTGLIRIYSGRKLIDERTIRKGWTSIAIGNHSTTHPGHEILYYDGG